MVVVFWGVCVLGGADYCYFGGFCLFVFLFKIRLPYMASTFVLFSLSGHLS